MSESATAAAGELVGRIFEAAAGAMDLFSIFLGEQLGYYRAIADHGPMTAAGLAEATGTNARYAREWLEQQAITGFLTYSPGDADSRTYSLPDGYASVLVDRESEVFAAPIARFLGGTGMQMQALVTAFRTGGGVSWDQFGDLARTAQADFNRPFFTGSLVDGYLRNIPRLDDDLRQDGAKVAEIGPGGGWALIATANAYPGLRADGFDIDGPSVELARQNIEDAGLADRVAVHVSDAGDTSIHGEYDLVAAYECIHDMPDPVAVLGTMRRLAKPGGTVLVMDERVAPEFGAVGDFNERMFYGFSILVCLPDGMAHPHSRATGTVMRESTLRAYAAEAGFADVEVLPLEHDMFRFYRLVA